MYQRSSGVIVLASSNATMLNELLETVDTGLLSDSSDVMSTRSSRACEDGTMMAVPFTNESIVRRLSKKAAVPSLLA
jgi:hypothetical protein